MSPCSFGSQEYTLFPTYLVQAVHLALRLEQVVLVGDRGAHLHVHQLRGGFRVNDDPLRPGV